MHASGQRLPSWHFLACEQALLFGRAKRASRGVAARSRVLARLVSLAQIGEFARRLLGTRLGNTHKLMRSPLSTQEQPIFIRLRTYPVGPVCPPSPPLTQEFLLREKLLLTLG